MDRGSERSSELGTQIPKCDEQVKTGLVARVHGAGADDVAFQGNRRGVGKIARNAKDDPRVDRKRLFYDQAAAGLRQLHHRRRVAAQADPIVNRKPHEYAVSPALFGPAIERVENQQAKSRGVDGPAHDQVDPRSFHHVPQCVRVRVEYRDPRARSQHSCVGKIENAPGGGDHEIPARLHVFERGRPVALVEGDTHVAEQRAHVSELVVVHEQNFPGVLDEIHAVLLSLGAQARDLFDRSGSAESVVFCSGGSGCVQAKPGSLERFR